MSPWSLSVPRIWRFFLCSILLFPLVPPTPRARADQWSSPSVKEATSENGKYFVRVEPREAGGPTSGTCRATLYRVEDGNRTELWLRYLINNVSPVQVFASDSGKYVETMDEWHSVGRFPVVIYGPRGRLVEVHNFDSLGLTGDMRHIRRSVSSIWWNRDSIIFFDTSGEKERFVVRLHWGKWLVLDLQEAITLPRELNFPLEQIEGEQRALVEAELKAFQAAENEDWLRLQESIRATLREKSREMLTSEEPRARRLGALVAGQEGFEEMIPLLRPLLKDDTTRLVRNEVSRTIESTYTVRLAAREALLLLGEKVEGVVVEEVKPR